MKQQNPDTSESGKTKILIVDDHAVVLQGIRKALEDETDFEIVGTAADGLEAVQQVKSLEPDIVIMDVAMPNLDGVKATHKIKRLNERIHVLIYTMFSDKEYIVSLFRLGISGYVLKGEPIEDLILAIRAVREGGSYYSSTAQDVLHRVQAVDP